MTTLRFLKLFLSIVICCESVVNGITTRFELIQRGTSFDGLNCAFSHHNSSRGVKFESSTKTCNSLSTDWFANQSIESGHNYWKLAVVELTIKQKSFQLALPGNFRYGDSIVLFLENETNGGETVSVQASIIDDALDGGRLLYVKNKKYPGVLLFNHFVNGRWGREKLMDDPFQGSTGKLEMVVQQKKVSVYANDVNIYNYTTPLPMPNQITIRSNSHDTICNEMRIIYRN